MSAVNRDRFLQCVAKSGILSTEAFEKWREATGDDDDAVTLARDLANKKLSTRWQAKMLLKGANRLCMGNYVLTDRIGKTEFGDRFEAMHRQLSRAVAIQYLPADLCASAEIKKKIFAFGSKLAKLDHGNLNHVYDIDEERKRIYLVSESSKGVDLATVRNTPMSSESVARIIKGCLSGLGYAHSRGVVHGSLSDETIVVGENNKAKIRGLTRFAVANALSDSPAEASADIEAVANIADSLLASIDESQHNESFASLSTAIAAIRVDSDSALDQLESWVGEFASFESVSDAELSLAPTVPRAEPTPMPATDTNAEPVELEEAAAEGWLRTLARNNPVAIIASSVVASLLLIGGTVFAASQMVGNASEEAVAQLDSETSDTAVKKRENRSSAKDAVVPADSLTDVEANKTAIASLFNKKPEPENKKPEPENKNPEPENRTKEVSVAVVTKKVSIEEEVNKAEPMAAESMAAKTEAAKAETAKAETAKAEVALPEKSTEAPAPAKEVAKKPKPVQSKQEDMGPKPGEDPFKKYARTVDLPEVGIQKQVSLGKLILEKRHLLGAEILCVPSVHRSKPIFILNRSADDRQTWDISYKKKKKTKPVIIAKLQKTPTELFFKWLPAASDVGPANYLRNCRIKLSTPTHSHWLTLRKPVKIEDFRFGTNQGSVKLEVDVPWLPNEVALNAKLGTIKIERQDKKNYQQRAYLEPAAIAPGQPARMVFHKTKAYHFLSLDVAADVRKKLILQAALVIEPIPDQGSRVLEDPAQMPQVAAQIHQLARQADQASVQAQASEMKADEKKVYSDAAKGMKERSKRVGYLEFIVPQLLNRDIPVIITYSLNDQHRIVLAHSGKLPKTDK